MASLLSCQYLRTPVVESQLTTLPTAVEPTPILWVISESVVNEVVVAPAPVSFIAYKALAFDNASLLVDP